MKAPSSFALVSAIASIAAHGIETNPIGWVSAGNTGAGDAVAAGSDLALSIPLANAAAFTGANSSTVAPTSTTLTVEGEPAWTPSTEWTTEPHVLIVTGGAEEGLIGLITDNTEDTLTVTTVTGDIANVAANESIRIEPAWTVIQLLPLDSVPNGTQLILMNESASGVNLGAAAIYTKGPGSWVQILGGAGTANDAVLYPGEGFTVRTPASEGIVDLTITGEVPTWNHRNVIWKASGASAADNFLSFYSPVTVEIQSAGIPATPGDQIIFFDQAAAGQNKGPSQILTRGPVNWFGILGPAAGIQDTYPIGGPAAFIYRRAAAAPNGDTNWATEQTYIPSL